MKSLEIAAIVDKLLRQDLFSLEKAAQAIAELEHPPKEFLPALIEAIVRLEGEDVDKGPRFEAECRIFEALLRYSDDPRLEKELPRIARRLIEVAGDRWPDDEDTPIRARTSDLLVLFPVPKELVAALTKVLDSDHCGFYIARRVVEALAHAGGEEAVRAIQKEAKREEVRLSTSNCSPLWSPGELAWAISRARRRAQ